MRKGCDGGKTGKQAEAEVVPSSSLVKIEVEVGVWVEVELIKDYTRSKLK